MSGPASRGNNKNQRAGATSALELDLSKAANSDRSPQSSASPGSDIRKEKSAESATTSVGGMSEADVNKMLKALSEGLAQHGMEINQSSPDSFTLNKKPEQNNQSPNNSTAQAPSVEQALKAPTAEISPSLTAAKNVAAAAENTSQITIQLTTQDPSTIPLPNSKPISDSTGPQGDGAPSSPQHQPGHGSNKGPQSTSNPTPTDDKGTTGGSSGGKGGGGGGGGSTTNTPDDDPDRGPGNSNKTPIEVQLVEDQFKTLIHAIEGVSTAVKSGNKIQAGQLIDLQAEIRALADSLKESSTKSQIDPALVEKLGEATEALTGAVSALVELGGKVDLRLGKITDELSKLSESLANIRFDDIVAGIEEISRRLERGADINKDLLTKILNKIDASSGTTKLDETQLKALTDAIARLEQGQAAQRNQADKLADKSNALLALMVEELKALREQMEKSKPQPQPEDQKLPDERKYTKKEDRDYLIAMLHKVEREGRHTLDVKQFLEELENRGFITIRPDVEEGGKKRPSKLDNRTFEIHYENPHPLEPLEKGATEKDADFEKRKEERQKEHYVTISNSAKELYSMKAWTWAPTLLTVGLLGGAAATVAVGAASIVTTAAVIAAPLYLSKMWMSKQVDQLRTRYDGVFKLPITQQAGSALSPEKMLLETLATYLHVQQLPEHIRWINWAPKGITSWKPDDVSTNDAYYATGPLIVAMKNTLKFWDNFKYNIPNLDDPKVVDPSKISELRTNEFDRVLEDFKKDWIGPIRQSFLKIPFACERVCGMGATVGVIAGLGSAVTSGGLSWLLRAIF